MTERERHRRKRSCGERLIARQKIVVRSIPVDAGTALGGRDGADSAERIKTVNV
jgi:hypothetical protein